MMNDNELVLNLIKKSYHSEIGERQNIKLPQDINFKLIGRDVQFNISSSAVCKNMQEDRTSFEGWALVLKRWGKFENVFLSWDIPQTFQNAREERHYQRFLFRVDCFAKHLDSWFKISKSSKSALDDLVTNGSGTFYINCPSDRKNEHEPQLKEGILEKRFIDSDLKEELKQITNAKDIDRQLPVGVFKGKVRRDSAIFSHGKSAIDLWGLSNDNKLLLFELKAETNKKVGILSEILFYVFLMKKVKDREFQLSPKSKQKFETLSQVNKIKGYLLAFSLHRLIDENLIMLLNRGSYSDIEFHYIQFSDRMSPSLQY